MFNFDDFILENKYVKLEPLTEQHLPYLLPIATQHPNLLQYSPSAFGTKVALSAYIQTALLAKQQKTRYPFAIFDKTKQCYVGSTSFGNISNKNLRTEIGWTWLAPKVHRTGTNRNVKFLMLQYAFEILKWERIELKTDARNQQSRKAIEGIGATYEGLLRSHTLMIDGYRRDTVYYSILRHEWPAIRASIFSKN